MSWIKQFESKISKEDLKYLRGIHPYRPTPGPVDFETRRAFEKSTRYTKPTFSNFGKTTENRLQSSQLGKQLKKGATQPGTSTQTHTHTYNTIHRQRISISVAVCCVSSSRLDVLPSLLAPRTWTVLRECQRRACLASSEVRRRPSATKGRRKFVVLLLKTFLCF